MASWPAVAGPPEKTPHGQWTSYLGSVGIHDRNAQIYMKLARQIRSASHLGPSIRATLDEIGASERAAREAERAARDERLAVRLESCPDGVEPVDHLRALLAKADKAHAEHVALVEKHNRKRAADERKFCEVAAALRALPQTPAVAGVVARFCGGA